MTEFAPLIQKLQRAWASVESGPLHILEVNATPVQSGGLMVPIQHQGTLFGNLHAPQAEDIDKSQAFMESWASLLALYLGTEKLSQGLTDELIVAWNRLSFLNEMASLMRATTDAQALTLKSLSLALNTIEAEDAFIIQSHNGEAGQQHVYSMNEKLTRLHADAVYTRLVQSDDIFVCNSVDGCQESFPDSEDMHSLLAQSFQLSSEMTVVIGLLNHKSGLFTTGDIQIFESLIEQIKTHYEIQSLHQQQSRNQQLKRELALASEIQQSFLPQEIPIISGYEVSTRLISASEIGGDFYDVHRAQDGSTSLLICDIAGKGISAALQAAAVRATIRSEIFDIADPSSVLNQANARLYEDMDSIESFATAILVMLPDELLKPAIYASAGHTTGLWIQASSWEVAELRSTSMPLGIMPVMDALSQPIAMQESDVLLLYSDGLTEAEDLEGRLFDQDKVSLLLLAVHQEPVEFIVDSLHRVSGAHRAGNQSVDDLTIIVLKKQSLISSEKVLYRQLFYLQARLMNLFETQNAFDTLPESIPSLSIPNRWLMETQLAVIESLTNVMLHAYPEGEGDVYCLFRVYFNRIEVELLDSGQPYVPQKTGPLVIDPENPPEGGYGLHIINQVMDEIDHSRLPGGENRWRFVRYLPAAKHKEEPA